MAKKVVATLKSADAKQFTKVINMVKNAKGAYSFETRVVPKDLAKDFLK
ncbi:MAG: DUF4295 family protein [Schleiferiaceae bacterium]|jgi:hypothetical protein|nr:DUF4295 family protein [Schleiferiaceae bacterium]MDG1917948.1 DUF4295 family protein [Schleiferiaceae bacterium]|tara:strand:- start:309 stop:455 length:147 start_codon:yes stop_codon:yes gene_type:complete